MALQVLATTFLANRKLAGDEYWVPTPSHPARTLTHTQPSPDSVLNVLRCLLLIRGGMQSRKGDIQDRSSGEKTGLEIKIKGCNENVC